MLSVQRWTLHTLKKRHTGDVVAVVLWLCVIKRCLYTTRFQFTVKETVVDEEVVISKIQNTKIAVHSLGQHSLSSLVAGIISCN